MDAVISRICYDFFFFFQAEDGIRDLTVTGVQTCALPIWIYTQIVQYILWSDGLASRRNTPDVSVIDRSQYLERKPMLALFDSIELKMEREIGRASCRERV